MDVMLGAGGLVVGLVLGYVVARMSGSKPAEAPEPPGKDWWEVRKGLTGTQLQILQFMEAQKEASIDKLQKKFSFIPDRELFYRLEQIVLLEFIERGRKDGEVTYTLNPEYSGTVEDDKTVMLSGDS